MGDVSIRVMRQRLVRPAAASGRTQALRAPLWDDRNLDHGRVLEAKRKREERQWERVVVYRELHRQRWRFRQGGVGWERTPRGEQCTHQARTVRGRTPATRITGQETLQCLVGDGIQEEREEATPEGVGIKRRPNRASSEREEGYSGGAHMAQRIFTYIRPYIHYTGLFANGS